MTFTEMSIEQLEERKAQIANEINNDDADLNALEEEVRGINTELESRINAAKEAEQRRKAIAEGAGTIIKQKEEQKMEERTFAIDSVEYRNAWLKKLQGKALNEEETRAMTASAAIPTTTVNKIIGVMERSPLINAVDVTYIPSNLSYPVESAFADAAWVAMGTAATDGTDTLTTVSLAAYKLIKTLEITADVEAMAVDAFEGWLVERLGNKIMKAVDASIINGTGSSQATGLVTTKSTADGTYTKAGMTYADLLTIIGSLKSEYAPNATFVCGRKLFYGSILGMVDTTKNRVVVADAQAPAKFNILGYPVIIDDNCADDDIYFGDLKYYKFNFAKSPEVSSDESVGFRTGSKVYRAMALADGKLSVAEAVKRYTKSST